MIEFIDVRAERLPEKINSDIIAFSVETYTAKRAYILAKKYKTEIKVRIDERNIPMYEAIHSVTEWWVSLGMEPAFVPEEAKEPCYSFWYYRNRHCIRIGEN